MAADEPVTRHGCLLHRQRQAPVPPLERSRAHQHEPPQLAMTENVQVTTKVKSA